LACFDYKGKLKWDYIANDTVNTQDTCYTGFSTRLIDTITIDKRSVIFLFANHRGMFPAEIFAIELKTGRRIPGALWHTGNITNAIIKKNETEIIFAGTNNSYKKAFIASVNVKNINGLLPCTDEYRFIGIKPAKFTKYITIPKSDLCNYKRLRRNAVVYGSLHFEENESVLSVNSLESYLEEGLSIVYKFNPSLDSLYGVIVDDKFVAERDYLVRTGKLPSPLSDSDEYRNKLRKSVTILTYEKYIKQNSELR